MSTYTKVYNEQYNSDFWREDIKRLISKGCKSAQEVVEEQFDSGDWEGNGFSPVEIKACIVALHDIAIEEFEK